MRENDDLDEKLDSIYGQSISVIASMDTGSDDGACVQIAIEKDGKIEIVAERHGNTADEAARAFAQTKGHWSSKTPGEPGWHWWRNLPDEPARPVNLWFHSRMQALVGAKETNVGPSCRVDEFGGEWFSAPIQLPSQ